ncbi:DUF971 domain-containing protein [Ideonella sp. DXS22W]|uniref:DUF971 domain-containing protein n=1 Tax=Pseudaquabacterium inlustre TaxID=2984192 RepID=A0ABU9CGL6_9BURK
MHHDAPQAIVDHRRGGVLEITWPDGRVQRLRHGLLRARCRCAACERQRRQGLGDAPADASVRLTHLAPVGAQGLNLQFSDGHDRGIYPWAYLRQLGGL